MFNRRIKVLRKLFLFIITAVLLISCEEETTLTFSEESFTNKTLKECADNSCPKIDITLLRAEGNSELVDIINTKTDSIIINTLSISPDDEERISTIQDGLDNIILSYREFKQDFPTSASEYEIITESRISYESSQIISIAIESYSYWGGAHGYGSIRYLNFDRDEQIYLNTDRLIKNKTAFLKEAENRFRSQQNIPADADINSSGYFFENNTFSLPQNIGFKEGNVVLVFNPYEVASYAEGQIMLNIPLASIKDYLAVTL